MPSPMHLAPTAHAANIHKREDPRSEFHKLLDEADGDPSQVVACPFGCDHETIDEFGYCDHLIGFIIPEFELKIEDGEVKRRPPEDAEVELLSGLEKEDRDGVGRRYITGEKVPLEKGDHLVRVIGTTRRVYRRDFYCEKPEVKVESKPTGKPDPSKA
jgi:hypothetical protein